MIQIKIERKGFGARLEIDYSDYVNLSRLIIALERAKDPLLKRYAKELNDLDYAREAYGKTVTIIEGTETRK